MSVKRDYSTGEQKHYEGPVHGGEGKQMIKDTQPYDFMGVHKSGPNPKLTPEGGFTQKRDGAEEPGFKLNESGYRGPQNWTPTNLGTRNPDDLEHS